MPREIPSTVIYYNPAKSKDMIAVKALHDADLVTDEVAADVLRLLGASYAASSQITSLVPSESVLKHFDADNSQRVAQHQARMQGSIGKGAVYHLVSQSGQTGYQSLIKSELSRANLAQKLGKQPPNCFVPDVCVSPEQQHKGLMTASWHAVLKFGGFATEVSVASDFYDVNSNLIKHLQKVLGFNASISPKKPEPYVIAGIELPVTRYEAASVGNSIAILEANNDWLKYAEAR